LRQSLPSFVSMLPAILAITNSSLLISDHFWSGSGHCLTIDLFLSSHYANSYTLCNCPSVLISLSKNPNPPWRSSRLSKHFGVELFMQDERIPDMRCARALMLYRVLHWVIEASDLVLEKTDRLIASLKSGRGCKKTRSNGRITTEARKEHHRFGSANLNC
jgi:hypothetical protein